MKVVELATLATNFDPLYIEATDWLLANSELFESSPTFWQGSYLYYEFDVLEDLSLEYIATCLDIGDDLVAVDSVWTSTAVIHGVVAQFEDMSYEHTLRAELKIEFTSILQAEEQRLSVKSHEINDVEILDIERDDDDPDFL